MWQNLERGEMSKEGFFKMKENMACLYNDDYDAIKRED